MKKSSLGWLGFVTLVGLGSAVTLAIPKKTLPKKTVAECKTCSLPKIEMAKWQAEGDDSPPPVKKLLIVEAGQTYRLHFTKPLGSVTELGWKADFGEAKWDADGDVTYTAPLDTLPDHLDHLSFPGGSGLPNIDLWMTVHGATVAATTRVVPMAPGDFKTTEEEDPMFSPADLPTASPYPDQYFPEHNWYNGTGDVVTIIGDLNGDNPDVGDNEETPCLGEEELPLDSTTTPALASNQVYYDTNADTDSPDGHLLIAWDKQKSPPKDCKKPPYHNRKPTKCSGNSWIVPSTINETQSTSGFHSNTFEGTVSGDIKAQMLANGGTVGANGAVKFTYKYREVNWRRTQYFDYWECVNGKPKFVYGRVCIRTGYSYLYQPAFMGSLLGGTTPQWLPPLNQAPSCTEYGRGY